MRARLRLLSRGQDGGHRKLDDAVSLVGAQLAQHGLPNRGCPVSAAVLAAETPDVGQLPRARSRSTLPDRRCAAPAGVSRPSVTGIRPRAPYRSDCSRIGKWIRGSRGNADRRIAKLLHHAWDQLIGESEGAQTVKATRPPGRSTRWTSASDSIRPGKVVHAEVDGHGIEAGVWERQRFGVGLTELDVGIADCRRGHHRRREVGANDAGAALGCRCRDVPGAGCNVEQPAYLLSRRQRPASGRSTVL